MSENGMTVIQPLAEEVVVVKDVLTEVVRSHPTVTLHEVL